MTVNATEPEVNLSRPEFCVAEFPQKGETICQNADRRVTDSLEKEATDGGKVELWSVTEPTDIQSTARCSQKRNES